MTAGPNGAEQPAGAALPPPGGPPTGASLPPPVPAPHRSAESLPAPVVPAPVVPAPVVVPEPRLPAEALVEPPPPAPVVPRPVGLDWMAAAAAGDQEPVGGPVAVTGTLIPRLGLMIGLAYVAVNQTVDAAAFVVWRQRDLATARPVIDASDTISRAVIPVGAVGLVSLLLWTYLVVRNARRLGLRSATPVVATICWLVPIVNLFVPWRQLRAVSRHLRAAAPVGVWWLFSLAGVVANRVEDALVENPADDVTTTLTRLAVASTAAALCFVVAGVAGVRSTMAIHRASRARAARRH